MEFLGHFILNAEGIHLTAELRNHTEHRVTLLVDERRLEAQSVFAVVLDVGFADLLCTDPLGPRVDDAVGRVIGVSIGPLEARAAGAVHRTEVTGKVRNLALALFADGHVGAAVVLLKNLGTLDVLDFVISHGRDHRLDELLGNRVLGTGSVLDFAGSLVKLVAVDHVERIGGITEGESLGGVLVDLLLLDRLNAEELGEVVGRITVTVERDSSRRL